MGWFASLQKHYKPLAATRNDVPNLLQKITPNSTGQWSASLVSYAYRLWQCYEANVEQRQMLGMAVLGQHRQLSLLIEAPATTIPNSEHKTYALIN